MSSKKYVSATTLKRYSHFTISLLKSVDLSENIVQAFCEFILVFVLANESAALFPEFSDITKHLHISLKIELRVILSQRHNFNVLIFLDFTF